MARPNSVGRLRIIFSCIHASEQKKESVETSPSPPNELELRAHLMIDVYTAPSLGFHHQKKEPFFFKVVGSNKRLGVTIPLW